MARGTHREEDGPTRAAGGKMKRIKVELEFVTGSPFGQTVLANVLRGEFEDLRQRICSAMPVVEWGSKVTLTEETDPVEVPLEPPKCIQCKRQTSFVRTGIYQCLNDKCRKYGRAVKWDSAPASELEQALHETNNMNQKIAGAKGVETNRAKLIAKKKKKK